MSRLLRWMAVAAPLLALVLLLLPPEGLARPGGGNTYRRKSKSSTSSSSRSRSSFSGSSSSSGSSSFTRYSTKKKKRSYDLDLDDDDDAPPMSDGAFYVFLFFVGMVVVVKVAKYAGQATSQESGWSTSVPSYSPPTYREERPRREQPREPPRRQLPPQELLGQLRTVGPAGPDGQVVPFDPDFSQVLFEDFLYALYAHAHMARAGGRLELLSAWLSNRARETLGALVAPAQVKMVVVGGMQYLSCSEVRPDSTRVTVRIRFEANYTEVSAQGAQQSWYATEEWTLSRSTEAKSRPPDKVREFKCPNCGAPPSGIQDNICGYCQQPVNTGRFDWVVSSVEVKERERRGPQLTGDTPEEGTHQPTVKQARVTEHLRELLAKDPAMSWSGFTQRVEHIFQELQGAWTQRKWELARPYVSDSLFQTQVYWMKAYHEARLRNVTENARITRTELARVMSDTYYDAITLRVFATGLDYTVSEDGQLVSGSRTQERAYSEYWTLIRRQGVQGRPLAEKRCPSCGAPPAVNWAGVCTHCDAKLSGGEYDWVLSRIEQDESYQG